MSWFIVQEYCHSREVRGQELEATGPITSQLESTAVNLYWCSAHFVNFVQFRIPYPGNGPTHSQDLLPISFAVIKDNHRHALRSISQVILDYISKRRETIHSSITYHSIHHLPAHPHTHPPIHPSTTYLPTYHLPIHPYGMVWRLTVEGLMPLYSQSKALEK